MTSGLLRRGDRDTDTHRGTTVHGQDRQAQESGLRRSRPHPHPDPELRRPASRTEDRERTRLHRLRRQPVGLRLHSPGRLGHPAVHKVTCHLLQGFAQRSPLPFLFNTADPLPLGHLLTSPLCFAGVRYCLSPPNKMSLVEGQGHCSVPGWMSSTQKSAARPQ